MKRYTANYSYTSHNFVIQNLDDSSFNSEYYPAYCIIKNIIQRGCPTKPSKYLQSIYDISHLNNKNSFPLISNEPQKWERVIRGDVKGNYFPAQKFYEKLLPKYLGEYSFIQQLIIPEVPITTITNIPVEEFQGKQVDFYLPQAFLVIEIDGSQHDYERDKVRDLHLAKYGVKTIRITTAELESEGDALKQKMEHIKERVFAVNERQLEKKKELTTFVSFEDYKSAHVAKPDFALPAFQLTAILRFQILLLESLKSGKLKLGEDWDFTVYSEQNGFVEHACEDILLWLEHLLRLQKLNFVRPRVSVNYVSSFSDLKNKAGTIKVDLSIFKRYTDEFQNHPEVYFIRTDYLEYYRYYKQANAVEPKYISLEPYDHFRVESTALVNYKFQFTGENDDQQSLSFFLDNIFGYSTFNQGQLPIITNALSRNDTLGLLPTGGGKSICYQLAAFLQPGISFVVCPIKSLMFDQKQDLESMYITRTNHITSEDDGEDKEKIMGEFGQGKYFYIFISPERFQIRTFRQYLLQVNTHHKFAYAVIDEVHCLSEWGHDFRMSYLNLSKTIQKHCTGYTFIGLTATASLNVLKDIQIEFGIKQDNVKTLTDYTRKELDFEVRDDSNNKSKAIKEILKIHSEKEDLFDSKGEDSKCTIIFTPTVNGTKGCYPLSTTLQQEFKRTVKYYAGSIPEVDRRPIMNNTEFDNYKRIVQDEFKQNAFTVLTATKAFGMGVNKRNVYYTFHYGIPGSMEALYQEAGRAGRDKTKFLNTKAKCYVLFTKSSNEDLLQTIWDRSTSLSFIKDQLPSVDGDVSTNLFLFSSSIDIIKDEYELIMKFIARYAKPGVKSVPVQAREIGGGKAKVEKAIYRLSQLGIVDDWTIENFYSGEFTVVFNDFNEKSVQKHLQATIKKYDKEFSFDSFELKEGYEASLEIWKKNKPLLDRCVVMLLQWGYDHFAYNRRQSLKNIYENCSELVDHKITPEQFKQRLEDYFKFTEASYLLQHITENPNDYKKWFEVFYQIENNYVSNKLINYEQRQSLFANLSRFLESYQYNTGLDFISGILRLLIDDFSNKDGLDRFESAFNAIKKYQKDDFDYVFNNMLVIGKALSFRSKNDLAMALIKIFPDDDHILTRIQNALGDEYTTDILLSKFNNRITAVNKKIYDGLRQIR